MSSYKTRHSPNRVARVCAYWNASSMHRTAALLDYAMRTHDKMVTWAVLVRELTTRAQCEQSSDAESAVYGGGCTHLVQHDVDECHGPRVEKVNRPDRRRSRRRRWHRLEVGSNRSCDLSECVCHVHVGEVFELVFNQRADLARDCCANNGLKQAFEHVEPLVIPLEVNVAVRDVFNEKKMEGMVRKEA